MSGKTKTKSNSGSNNNARSAANARDLSKLANLEYAMVNSSNKRPFIMHKPNGSGKVMSNACHLSIERLKQYAQDNNLRISIVAIVPSSFSEACREAYKAATFQDVANVYQSYFEFIFVTFDQFKHNPVSAQAYIDYLVNQCSFRNGTKKRISIIVHGFDLILKKSFPYALDYKLTESDYKDVFVALKDKHGTYPFSMFDNSSNNSNSCSNSDGDSDRLWQEKDLPYMVHIIPRLPMPARADVLNNPFSFILKYSPMILLCETDDQSTVSGFDTPIKYEVAWHQTDKKFYQIARQTGGKRVV